MTDDRDKEEVKNMFQLLLDGQQKQQKTSEAFGRKIVTNLGDLRQEMHAKNDLTTGRLDPMATTMTDFSSKLKELEEKFAGLQDGGEVQAQAGEGGGGRGGGARDARAPPTARSDGLKVVIGGWNSPELKRVLEERVRQLLGEWNDGVVDDIYSYKRAQVAYAIFKSQRDVISLIAWTRTEKPRALTEGDDDTIWAKVSQPPELRARTLPLRSAARAIYAYFESAKLPFPQDMAVDYHRNEIVVENYVIVSVKGLGDVTWHANVWARRVPNAPMDEIRAAAGAFSAPRE